MSKNTAKPRRSCRSHLIRLFLTAVLLIVVVGGTYWFFTSGNPPSASGDSARGVIDNALGGPLPDTANNIEYQRFDDNTKLIRFQLSQREFNTFLNESDFCFKSRMDENFNAVTLLTYSDIPWWTPEQAERVMGTRCDQYRISVDKTDSQAWIIYLEIVG